MSNANDLLLFACNDKYAEATHWMTVAKYVADNNSSYIYYGKGKVYPKGGSPVEFGSITPSLFDERRIDCCYVSNNSTGYLALFATNTNESNIMGDNIGNVLVHFLEVDTTITIKGENLNGSSDNASMLQSVHQYLSASLNKTIPLKIEYA